MAFDWSAYATGGATRPDSFSGMNPQFAAALQRMFEGAPANIRDNLRVGSGFRSVARQKELWAQALKKYGSPQAARKWVAPPGNSQHNMGFAADLKYLDPEALKWAHANAGNYGLAFPLGNENWHVELAGSRKGGPGLAALVNRTPDAVPVPASPVSSQIAAREAAPPQVPGSMAPPLHSTTIQDRQVAPPVDQGAPASEPFVAQDQPKSPWDILGSMALMQPEQPQFQPVEIRGPSPEQAQALTSFIEALKKRAMV